MGVIFQPTFRKKLTFYINLVIYNPLLRWDKFVGGGVNVVEVTYEKLCAFFKSI